VTLRIYFEGLTLTKKYSGHDGFPLFLADFKDGSKTFTPEDFPQAQGILKELNVSEIKVSYEITDSNPVIKLVEKVPRQTPTVIADCWDH
jgi:type VI secretion system protein ImpL